MTTVNEMEIELKEPLIPVEEYLAAGVHIGTQQKSEDMKKFIYRVRGDGLYILDIRETDARIKTAAKFLNQYEAPNILVVTSRQYGQYPAKKLADTIGAMSATGTVYPGTAHQPGSQRIYRTSGSGGHRSDRRRPGNQRSCPVRNPCRCTVRYQQYDQVRGSGYPYEQQGSQGSVHDLLPADKRDAPPPGDLNSSYTGRLRN